jgi:hypothetical protein
MSTLSPTFDTNMAASKLALARQLESRAVSEFNGVCHLASTMKLFNMMLGETGKSYRYRDIGVSKNKGQG